MHLFCEGCSTLNFKMFFAMGQHSVITPSTHRTDGNGNTRVARVLALLVPKIKKCDFHGCVSVFGGTRKVEPAPYTYIHT